MFVISRYCRERTFFEKEIERKDLLHKQELCKESLFPKNIICSSPKEEECSAFNGISRIKPTDKLSKINDAFLANVKVLWLPRSFVAKEVSQYSAFSVVKNKGLPLAVKPRSKI